MKIMPSADSLQGNDPSQKVPWKGRKQKLSALFGAAFIFALSVLPFTRALASPSATNLVGRWFSGAQTLADISGYQPAGTHDGFDIGNPGGSYYFTNDVPPGKSGYSLFLANDGIFITNSSSFDSAYTNTFDDTIHNGMTVAFWAKGWPGQWNPWVSKYGETSPTPAGGWQLRNGGNNSNATWTMRGAGGAVAVGTGIFGNPDELLGTIASNDGRWHAYMGTYDSVTHVRSLYVDGVLSGQETNIQTYTLAPYEHLCIGAKDSPGYGFSGFFTGEIYDVRIYSYPLNPAISCAIPALVTYSNVTVYPGQSAQLNSQSPANPSPNLGYGWTSNGVAVLNANTNILTISNVTVGAQYEFMVTNQCGETYSPKVFNVSVISANLVGRWFSGAPTLADASGYQLPGTHDGYDIGNPGGGYYFTNDVPPGRFGYSLYLTNDGIFITNSSILDAAYTNTFDDTIHTAMTVSFWAKGYPGTWNPWVSKWGDVYTSASAGWQLRHGGNNANAAWTIRGAGGTVTQGTAVFGNPEELRGTIATHDDNWHYYVGTFDSVTGVRNLFVDGVKAASATNGTAYTLAPMEHLCFGARDSTGTNYGNFFTGELYDVRIFTYPVPVGNGCAIPLIIATADISVRFGQSVQLNPGSGSPNYSYAWTSNGVFILDANTSSLTLSNVTRNAQYAFHVTTPCGSTYVPEFFNVHVITPPPTPIRYSNSLVLMWTNGTLLQATNPLGPWTPTGMTSPYTNDMSTNSQMFYRVSYP